MLAIEKSCPSCEHRLTSGELLNVKRETLTSCEYCGAYHRWRPTALIGFTAALAAVKILVAIALGMMGLWAFFALFVVVSIPVLTFLTLQGLEPVPADFGGVAQDRLSPRDKQSTLH